MKRKTTTPNSAPVALARVPNEIWALVTELLPGSDIKSLRLASGVFARRVLLRLDRVFLSPNRLNIEVFLAIAKHEIYRKRVVELVYDDARFVRSDYWEDDRAYSSVFEHPLPDPERAAAEEEWFRSRRDDNFEFRARQHLGLGRPRTKEIASCMDASDRLMPRSAALQYYQNLVAQQARIIQSGADAEALAFGLQRFPALKRITITPLAHGFPFEPAYETPMIRAFPAGFKYPLHEAWAAPEFHDRAAESLSWVFDSAQITSKSVRSRWRGYCVVSRALAEHGRPRQVTELAIEGFPMETGLSINLFSDRGRDYDNFVKMVSDPAFRHLDLSLSVGSEKADRWRVLRSGLFKEALAQAPKLEFLSLATNVAEYDEIFGDSVRQVLSLTTIFPEWTHLRYFRLWKMIVSEADLVQFLNRMPQALERADLALLYFFSKTENHWHLLERMQSTLSWRSWERRPKLRMAIEYRPNFRHPFRVHWLDTEVDEFLYSDGPNPFGLPEDDEGNKIMSPVGILRDPIDPSYEKSWAYYCEHEREEEEYVLHPAYGLPTREELTRMWARRLKFISWELPDMLMYMILLGALIFKMLNPDFGKSPEDRKAG